MKKSLFFVYLLCGVLSLSAQIKPDALKLFRDGRSLDERGRTEEAKDAYTASVAICLTELSQNPRNLESSAAFSFSFIMMILSAGKYFALEAKNTSIFC